VAPYRALGAEFGARHDIARGASGRRASSAASPGRSPTMTPPRSTTPSPKSAAGRCSPA